MYWVEMRVDRQRSVDRRRSDRRRSVDRRRYQLLRAGYILTYLHICWADDRVAKRNLDLRVGYGPRRQHFPQLFILLLQLDLLLLLQLFFLVSSRLQRFPQLFILLLQLDFLLLL
jgi:hypothetical protein